MDLGSMDHCRWNVDLVAVQMAEHHWALAQYGLASHLDGGFHDRNAQLRNGRDHAHPHVRGNGPNLYRSADSEGHREN